jgi:hypothetical protein
MEVGVRSKLRSLARWPLCRESPQGSKVQLDGVERLGSHRLPAGDDLHDGPARWTETQCLEGLLHGVDQPRVRHTGFGVDGQLAAAIDALRRRRENLADPVGSQLEPRAIGDLGQALSTPATDVRDDGVVTEAELRLGEQPPASGALLAAVEATPELPVSGCLGACGSEARPWSEEELPVEDLRHLVLGGVQHVLVRRALHAIPIQRLVSGPV